jgi:hypothetical protein
MKSKHVDYYFVLAALHKILINKMKLNIYFMFSGVNKTNIKNLGFDPSKISIFHDIFLH